MASAFQGFAINLNLSENFADRDVLNNLGGEPIADDIVLFLNNLRNFSTLNVIAGLPPTGNIDGSYISFNEITQKFVFTDKTQITVDDTIYYVGDSNTFNRFRLYTDENLVNLVISPPVGIYKRSDAVTAADVKKLVPTRDKVIENVGSSQYSILNSNPGELIDQNFYNSFIRVYNRLFDNIGYQSTIRKYFEIIEKQIDYFEFVKKQSINEDTDFSSDNILSLAGNFLIKDPGGVNNLAVSTTDGPGIFILNTDNNTSKRIFSGNENAWSDAGTYLEVDSNEIVVGNLVFNEPPAILRKSGLPAIVTETSTDPNVIATTSFTHFVSIMVNNEEYFLLLK